MDWNSTLEELAIENDSLNTDLEKLVNAPKVAVEITPKKRKHSIPNEVVLRVKLTEGYPRSLKVLATKAGGQWYISLVTDRSDILRKYHYQYRGHPNPDDTITGRSHKHFPTLKCPLLESHKEIKTWAYDPEPFPDDFGAAVKHFCKECKIDMGGIQERLPLEWF